MAQHQESKIRSDELKRLTNEDRYANGELEKIEGTRLRQREIAANERNVIASTREVSKGGAVGSDGTRFRSVDTPNLVSARRGTTLGRALIGAAAHVRVVFDPKLNRSRLDQASGFASGYSTERGLGDRHYRNVNNREAEQDERLDDREGLMLRRLRRISKDKAKQINRPNAGMTPSVRAMLAKSKALYTYIDFPVAVASELSTLIAFYR